MSWAAASAAPAGSDTQVQYNNKSSFGGSSSFTFDSGTGIVSATGFSGALNGTVGATTPAAGTFITATARAAATQDSVVLQGRAGGTSSYAATITPTTLTASRTVTLPDANMNFATGLPVANGGTGLTSGNSGGVPYFSNTSAISSSAALTQYGIVYGGGAGAAPVATAAGTTGQFLGANTSGAPTWQTPTAGAAGSNTQVQFNDGGTALGGDAGLTYDKTTDNLTIAGNLVIGTSGKGIDFSATPGTGTSELLADYEEGTWLPTFTTSGAAFTSITYDIRNGSYVKIGSYVYCEAHLRVATVSGGSGAVLLSNFPFATLGSSFPNPGGYFQLASGFVVNTPSSLDASGASATTYNMLYRTTANGALSTTVPTTDIAVGSFIRATVVFQTS
jgi:hypothetical protein